MVGGRRVGDTLPLSEPSIQPTGDEATEKGGNGLINGFEGKKEKYKIVLIDKKQVT